MSELDDAAQIAAIDRSGMASQILSAPEQIEETVRAAKALNLQSRTRTSTDAVFLAGIGGSAIPGDIIRDWATDKLRRPFEVCRGERLPGYATNRSLTIAVSYSGETRETINLFLDAERRRSKVVAIASGGRLTNVAQSARIPVLGVRKGLQPRAALPSLLAGVFVILGKFRALPDLSNSLLGAARDLRNVTRQLGPGVPESENRAKQTARLLHGGRIVVYSSERLGGVARRMKNQLNELSKLPAAYSTLPESAHNEIESWQELARVHPRTIPVFIDDGHYTKEERLSVETFKLKLRDCGVNSIIEISSDARDPTLALLATLVGVDFVAYYIALLRKVDPVKVPVIDSYKKSLAESLGSHL